MIGSVWEDVLIDCQGLEHPGVLIFMQTLEPGPYEYQVVTVPSNSRGTDWVMEEKIPACY